MKALPKQPEINIGTTGHVDHGKTTLVQALTGVWAARHSEELRRGVTIKIGYADTAFWKCPSCPPPTCYSTKETCPNCGSPTQFLRATSFVDCPGHEVLMTTMLAGAAIMDGTILVIAADEPVPQPQTREHLLALETIEVKNIVIVQNKVDIVSREQAMENYEGIKKFIDGTIAEDAPIIPLSAQHGTNIDVLIEAMENYLPTPERDPTKSPRMYVLRSFDVNRPGLPIEEMVGGVIGGALLQGEFEVGDEIELRPGIKIRDRYEPIFTEIVSLRAGGKTVERVRCGGLVAIGTRLDPALTKADGLLGNIVGKPGMLPPTLDSLTLDVNLFELVVGMKEPIKVDKIAVNEPLVLNVGTAVSAGTVTSLKGDIIDVALKKPVCAETGTRVTVSRRIADRWRLIGYGKIIG